MILFGLYPFRQKRLIQGLNNVFSSQILPIIQLKKNAISAVQKMFFCNAFPRRQRANHKCDRVVLGSRGHTAKAP